MNWIKKHAIAIGIFAVPILIYYYAVRYEIDYLRYFGVNAEQAQLNPIALLNTFYVLQITVFAIELVVLLYLFTTHAILKFQISHPRFIRPQKQPGTFRRQMKYAALAWMVIFGIPLLNSSVAGFNASLYIKKPVCITPAKGEKEAILIRQYGDKIIIREANHEPSVVAHAGPYTVIEDKDAASINPNCKE